MASQRTRSFTSEEMAFRAGEAEMKKLIQTRSNLASDMRESLSEKVKTYKTRCMDLLTHRTACLQRVSSLHPQAGLVLEADPRYLITVPDKAIFDIGGIIVSYTPDGYNTWDEDDRDGRDSRGDEPRNPSTSRDQVGLLHPRVSRKYLRKHITIGFPQIAYLQSGTAAYTENGHNLSN
jgi:hypothetical protein